MSLLILPRLQVYPGSLQGRLALMPSSMLQKGKATCLEENVYVKFQAVITLNDIFHLPLVPAEYNHTAADARPGHSTPDMAAPPSKGSSRLGTNSIPTSKQPSHDLKNLAEAIARKANLSQPPDPQLAVESDELDNPIANAMGAVNASGARRASRSHTLTNSTMRVYNNVAASDAIQASHEPAWAASADVEAGRHVHSDDSALVMSMVPLWARYELNNPAYEQDGTILGATSIKGLTGTVSDARLSSDSDELAPSELKQSRHL